MRKLVAVVGVLLFLGASAQVGFAYPFGGEIAGQDARQGDSINGRGAKKGKVRTPERIAELSFERGVRARDEALEAEKKLAASQPGFWHDRYATTVEKSWAKAIERYQEAISAKPDFFEAYSDLGFAYRKTGDLDRALAAYDRALQINPEYPNALEYLGETYLKLTRLDDAKSTYMKLFGVDRDQAAVLMNAMNEWLAKQPTAGASADVDAFRQGVSERKQLAEQVGGSAAQARAW
jgi:tetratricopeptide (TPR) repeat protein